MSCSGRCYVCPRRMFCSNPGSVTASEFNVLQKRARARNGRRHVDRIRRYSTRTSSARKHENYFLISVQMQRNEPLSSYGLSKNYTRRQDFTWLQHYTLFARSPVHLLQYFPHPFLSQISTPFRTINALV